MSEVLIASQLDADANDYLRQRLPDQRIVDIEPGPDALGKVPEQASVFIVRPINVRGVNIAEPPAGWPWNLDWVQLGSSGIDFYPRWLFDAPQVTSAKGANADHVAEFALAAVFAAAKRLPDIWVKDDDWHFTYLQPLQGSTLGILGFGAIGQTLARKAQALGIRVLALGRPGHLIADIPGVEAASGLEQLFAESDHLVIAAPLTEQTRHLIGRQALAHAKPGLHLVNLARGGLLDQQALLEALEDGRLGRATLDVTDPEPLPAGHPLYQHPRVHISPHTSALSTDGKARFVDSFVDNFQRYRQRMPLNNLVDIQRGY
ncbi:D-isomer specific 2-hydroxyacid dehydrogenase family protein [Stutzerimonas kirkiae]|uniref:D-isomer specific 2-hydroxyacid dehydrogenase family protein n=1 Tax=Stutzerimonas kirkiae TaxID=2211392 RepID=UPI0010383973|nr:D-isomer specific 2-hydroxyacid dehydrogenase family protein [Stutzerimonas kirkiae]TBV15392.1 dihydrofolate reductase [Stutzerimonas kirkiae]